MTAAVECQACGYQWTLDNEAVREAARTSVFPECCQCGEDLDHRILETVEEVSA